MTGLSKDELPERYQGLLTRADANKDGFLASRTATVRGVGDPAAGPGRRGGEGDREGERGRGREGGRGGPPFGDPSGRRSMSAATTPCHLWKYRPRHQSRKTRRQPDGVLTIDELMPRGQGRGDRLAHENGHAMRHTRFTSRSPCSPQVPPTTAGRSIVSSPTISFRECPWRVDGPRSSPRPSVTRGGIRGPGAFDLDAHTLAPTILRANSAGGFRPEAGGDGLPGPL